MREYRAATATRAMSVCVLLACLHSDASLSLLSLQARRNERLNMWAPTLQLRGGGRHHKAKEKVVYQDKVACRVAVSVLLRASACCD